MRTTGQPYRKHRGVPGDFDAIVIGSGMGGMTVATILARYGQRVLLLEQNTTVGGLTQSYSRDGYVWNTGLHYVGDVDKPSKTTRRLFDYLTDGQVEWSPLPQIYNRMIIGEREYPIPAGANAFRSALIGWFPGEVEAIDAYLEDIAAVSLASRAHFAQKALPQSAVTDHWDALNNPFHEFSDLRTAEALARYGASDELSAVLCANWGDYSAPPSRSSYAMHCMLNKHYMDGGSYPVGGASRLAETMMPVVEAAGGMVLHSAHVERLLVAEGTVRGVRLASGEEVICPTVISNAGVQNTFGRLMDEAARERIGADSKLSEVSDTYALVGLNIGLSADAQALQLNPANIWKHPSPDFDENLRRHREDFNAPFPWLFMTFPSAKDPSWNDRHPNKSTVEMYGYSNFEHFSRWAGTPWRKRGDDYLAVKEDVKQRLLSELFSLVPSLESAVDVVEVSTPLTYESFVCRERGGFMGIESNPSRFQLPWLRAHTDIEGLFLTGQDVTTDGVIGALLGGILSSSAVLQRDVLADIRATAA